MEGQGAVGWWRIEGERVRELVFSMRKGGGMRDVRAVMAVPAEASPRYQQTAAPHTRSQCGA